MEIVKCNLAWGIELMFSNSSEILNDLWVVVLAGVWVHTPTHTLVNLNRWLEMICMLRYKMYINSMDGEISMVYLYLSF